MKLVFYVSEFPCRDKEALLGRVAVLFVINLHFLKSKDSELKKAFC